MKKAVRFYECGCCGHYHKVDWYGDCRSDGNRFTYDEMVQHAMDMTGELPDYTTVEEQE
jgi:hypothetical protein